MLIYLNIYLYFSMSREQSPHRPSGDRADTPDATRVCQINQYLSFYKLNRGLFRYDDDSDDNYSKPNLDGVVYPDVPETAKFGDIIYYHEENMVAPRVVAIDRSTCPMIRIKRFDGDYDLGDDFVVPMEITEQMKRPIEFYRERSWVENFYGLIMHTLIHPELREIIPDLREGLYLARIYLGRSDHYSVIMSIQDESDCAKIPVHSAFSDYNLYKNFPTLESFCEHLKETDPSYVEGRYFEKWRQYFDYLKTNPRHKVYDVPFSMGGEDLEGEERRYREKHQ